MRHVPVDARIPSPAAAEALTAIQECLGRIQFGSIAITVHEGRIVQFDVTEKRRIGL